MTVVGADNPAGRAWFARDSLVVAPALLGAELTRHDDLGDVTVRITEVEAYRGSDDPGSHAFRGETPRTRVMFGEAAHTFVYLTYGMHRMINVVTNPVGEAAGVLIRAGEVIRGLELARARRPRVRDRDLARGPARLAAALGVELDENAIDFFAADRYSLRLPSIPVTHMTTLRAGVSGPGGLAPFHWRFAEVDSDGLAHPTVSPYRIHPTHRRSGAPPS
ncbi:MAG TPA: DNA-3-methyladenine glycosylase [Microbacteriaceae bacterium]|nr:DNA-3-methyladenine glycosylase [Microbacteriaceae bacterium]